MTFAAVPTDIALFDETLLQQRLYTDANPVLYDTITEGGGEYFPYLGYRHTEADTLAGHISPLLAFLHQDQQIGIIQPI